MDLRFAASLALYGTYIYHGFKTPLPGMDQDVSNGLDVRKHEFVTADGLTLRLKRYANPGSTPVLLTHGFGGNGFSLDLPRAGRNMAVYLAREGLDVWVASFRGCGREPYISDGGDWSHSFDHLAIYDACAIVDGIAEETGRKVFWIGHSMGGIVLYMYLQGVRFADGGVVLSEAALVEERHGRLLGGATLGAATVFCFPYNDPSRVGLSTEFGRRLVRSEVEILRVKEEVAPRVYGIGRGGRLPDRHPRLAMAVTRSPLAGGAYNRANTDKDTTSSLARWGTDDVSTAMWVQRLFSVIDGHLRQYPSVPRSSMYDYAANIPLVRLPILFITGDHDHGPAIIERYAYGCVSSEMKEFLQLPEYGHIDLLIGKHVERDVYPAISSWIEKVEVASRAR
ncbi:MAG TPA: alpha/beta fold hydrolase [Candidatus Anoxymicrobiaceae bacterium]|jgi:pimeloyl-ACP methyl ester carboxylesterase